MGRIFSGIQPSGMLTIGHYLGTINHWLSLQQEHDCYFCVVDLHAITVQQEPSQLKQRTLSAMALYLACGLDYKRHNLFIQSHVPAHSELAWILQCLAPLGQLQRMTQFKDKSEKHTVNAGLLTYPVLMASDIVLYASDLVPVGEDQKQHLEFARDLVLKFNHQYGEILQVPEPVIADHGARIMSLQDPTNKMSKSDPNQQAWLGLLDPPELITKKIKRAVTDSQAKVAFDSDRPGISNLVTIYSCLADCSHAKVEEMYAGQGYGQFKTDLADLIISKFEPIQQSYYQYIEQQDLMSSIIAAGAEAANAQANIVLDQVKAAIGLK